MNIRTIDLIVTKIGAVVFMVAAYFVIRPTGYIPIVAIGAAIFVVGLPISVSVWQKQIVDIIKAKTGGVPSSGTVGQTGTGTSVN